MSSTKQQDTAVSSQDPQLRGPPNIQPRPKLSKSERRDLQEKQKAAKAAASSSTNAKDKPKEPRAAARGAQPPPPKDSASVESAETGHVLRDLRIFSHFGFPSRIVSSAGSAKADIHPSILRLALQFAEFRIVGANARCISTLTAFKTVDIVSTSFIALLSTPSTGDSRLCYAPPDHSFTAPYDTPISSNHASCFCTADVH